MVLAGIKVPYTQECTSLLVLVSMRLSDLLSDSESYFLHEIKTTTMDGFDESPMVY